MYVAEGFTEPNLAGWGITQRQRGTGMTDGLERRKFTQSVGLLAGSTAAVAATQKLAFAQTTTRTEPKAHDRPS